MSTFHLKNPDALGLQPELVDVLEWIKEQFGLDFITQVKKPGMEDRHTDLRCRNEVVGANVERAVNRRWQYDPERPRYDVAWWHKSDRPGSEYHLHLQVHPNTRRREL